MGLKYATTVLLVCACLSRLNEAKSLPGKRTIRRTIEDYQDDVNRIIEYVQGPGRHASYNLLFNLTDKHGPRLAPSAALEASIDDVIGRLQAAGYANVAGEQFTIPNWTPGSVYTASMTAPREVPISILPLGTSVGTGGPLQAEAIVVNSFDELDSLNDNEVMNKIVVYNQEWVNYGETNMYRTYGALEASKRGAKAALVRSVADYSVYSPHTGVQSYNASQAPEIPVACITHEDAEMLRRIQDRGTTIEIRMEMDCGTNGEGTTRNVVAELTGSTKPDETVIFGGHIDSWYVGDGVMDDMGGVAISWEAMNIMRALGLIPKRTVRAVFWSAEEIGVYGGEDYFENHKDEADKTSLVMESDYGTFKPRGVGFSGNSTARGIIQDILSLLSSINATEVDESGAQADNGPWIEHGVPGANMYNWNEDYFFYHHTDGDSVTMQDPDDLDLCTIVWTTVAYIVADLDELLPR